MARRSTAITVAFSSAILVIAVAGLAFWLRAGSGQSSATPLPTPEAKAYFPEIAVEDAKMSAAKNFLGDTVVYLDARLTNKGSKTVRRLDLQLEFADTLGQVVLREVVHPVTARTAPLAPGESRALHIAFDHMPIDWNQAPPTVTVRYLSF